MKAAWGEAARTAFGRMLAELFVGQSADEETRELFDRMQRASTDRDTALAYLERDGDATPATTRASSAVPTLIVHRRDDAIAPFESAKVAASLIPGARFVPLAGDNHWPMADDLSAPVMIRAIREFLDEAGALARLARDPARGATLLLARARLRRKRGRYLGVDLLVAAISVAEVRDEVALLEEHRHHHVRRGDGGEQQMPGAHHRRRPEDDRPRRRTADGARARRGPGSRTGAACTGRPRKPSHAWRRPNRSKWSISAVAYRSRIQPAKYERLQREHADRVRHRPDRAADRLPEREQQHERERRERARRSAARPARARSSSTRA